MERYKKHPAELVLLKYKQQFNDIDIIPLQLLPQRWGKGDPLLGYIFCHSLKTLTPHTCRQVELGAAVFLQEPSNPSSSVSYHNLADAAFAKRIVHKNRIRKAMINRIREGQLSKNLTAASDFPLKCMETDIIERLERLSLHVERRLFGNNWTHSQEHTHHTGFLNMIAKQQHCRVDTDKILLEDQSWIDFLAAS
jgi:hypothetical protein